MSGFLAIVLAWWQCLPIPLASADIEPEEAILRFESLSDSPDPFSPNGDGRLDTTTLSATAAFRPDDPEGLNPLDGDFAEDLAEDRDEILGDLSEFSEDAPGEVGLIRVTWTLQDPATTLSLRTLTQEHLLQPPFTLEVLPTIGSNVGHFLIAHLSQSWDGRDHQGTLVADGIYPYTVQGALIEREQEPDELPPIEEELLLLTLVGSGTITLDTTPPVITDLMPINDATLDTPRPTISASFSDALSGIDVTSVRLTVDGTDVTAQASISPSTVSFTPLADFPDGPHTAIVDVADLAGNAASAATAFSIVTGPPVTPQSGFIHGEVHHALTGDPLAGAQVTVRSVEGAVETDAEGQFQFPTPAGGAFLLTVRKAGFLPSQRHAEVLSTHDVAVDPIFLTPVDPTVTVIPPEGGLARNSTGTIEVEIPAGALAEPLAVQATELTADEQLPAPLPTTSFFTYALDLQPDGATFNQPVTVRVKNWRNFTAGTPIPVGLYHFDTGEWLHETLGQISADGVWVVFQTRHFTPYDCNFPPIPPVVGSSAAPEVPKILPLTPPVAQPRCEAPIGSTVCPGKGDLGIEHPLPIMRTLSQARAPVLVYQSLTADPSRVIGADYTLETVSQPGDPGTLLPTTTTAVIQVEGQRVEAVFVPAEGLSRYAVLWDGRNARGERVPTGVYPYTVTLSHDYAGTFGTATIFGGPALADTGVTTGELIPLASRVNQHVLVVNHRDSPFGAGWRLKDLLELHEQPDGSVLLVAGDGSAIRFRPGPMDDLVVLNTGAGAVSLFTGHGDGSFQPGPAMPAGGVFANANEGLVVADFDADGRDDIALGLVLDQKIAIHRGLGQGRFAAPTLLPLAASPVALAAHDMDGDGDEDLLVITRPGDELLLLANQGDGTLASPLRMGVGAGPTALAVGDLNQDGRADVVVTSQDRTLSVFLGSPAGLVSVPPSPAGQAPAGVVIADFDGDGSSDVVVSNFQTAAISWLAGRGDGSFGASVVVGGIGPGPFGLASDDFDHDGRLDVALALAGSTDLAILFGRGDGTFDRPVLLPAGANSSAVIARDLNGDGHADLAYTAAQRGGDAGVILGNGDRTFQARRRLTALVALSTIAVGEFDDQAGLPDRIFRALPGEFSTLAQHVDGTWTRRLPDGTLHHFNAAGRQTAVVDRNGNTASYAYDAQDRLMATTYPGGAKWTFTYDVAGRLASMIDSTGRRTQFLVNAAGDLVRITNLDGTARAFSYDGEHRLTSQTSERGFITAYAYDEFGRLKEALLPPRPVLDHSTGLVTPQQEVRRLTPSETQGVLNALPPGVGSPEMPSPIIRPAMARLQDAAGNTTQLLIDHFGAPTKLVDPLGRMTTIERDVNGNPIKITRPNGAEAFLTYDNLGNLTSTSEMVTRPDGPFAHRRLTQFEYEPAFNQVTRITDARRDSIFDPIRPCPEGCVTRIEHDGRGNPTQIIDHEGHVTSFEYDSRGLLLTITDALGNLTPAIPDDHQTRFAYDPLSGNLLSSSDQLGNTTTLSYDTLGNVATSTDAETRTTTFTYDAMNRLGTVLDAAGGTTRYDYDAAGNLIRVSDANTHATSFTYDALNQLTSTTNPLSQTKQFFYDVNRNLGRVLDAKGQTVDFRYDAANQLKTKILKGAAGAVADTVLYDYDTVGNLTLVQDGDSKLTFAYDSAGRLITATTGDPANPSAFAQPVTALDYFYDPNGNRRSLGGPAQIQVGYLYDGLNRLTSVSDSVLSGRNFEYDALGRLTRLSRGPLSSFTYDDASQLLSIDTTLLGNPLESFAYTYDHVGNRSSLTDRLGLHTYAYDALSRLTRADHPLLAPPPPVGRAAAR